MNNVEMMTSYNTGQHAVSLLPRALHTSCVHFCSLFPFPSAGVLSLGGFSSSGSSLRYVADMQARLLLINNVEQPCSPEDLWLACKGRTEFWQLSSICRLYFGMRLPGAAPYEPIAASVKKLRDSEPLQFCLGPSLVPTLPLRLVDIECNCLCEYGYVYMCLGERHGTVRDGCSVPSQSLSILVFKTAFHWPELFNFQIFGKF